MPPQSKLSRFGRIATLFSAAALGTGAVYSTYNTLNPAIPFEEAARQASNGMADAAADYVAGTIGENNPNNSVRRMCSLLEEELNAPLEKVDASADIWATYDPDKIGLFGRHEICYIHIGRNIIAEITDPSDLDSASEIADMHARMMKYLPETALHKLSRAATDAPKP